MALADRAELAVRLTLDDRSFTGGVRRASTTLGKLDKVTSNTQRALGRTGAALQRTAVILATATAGGFIAVVKAAGDFELAFAGVRKTAEEDVPGAFDVLRKKILDLSTTMPIAATELAAIGETAGALGIHIQDIDEFIEVVAKLGVTTNLTTDEAAESLGKIGTILGLTGSEFETFADILVNLGNKGASTEAEIIEITKRFAASGQQAGLSVDEILAFSSAIASAGAEPEAAGSSLSRLFGNLITEVATASEKGEAFADVTGKSFKDFSKIVKTDTLGAMLLFLDSLKDLDSFAQQVALEDVGITNVRDRNAILLLAETFDTNLVPALQNAADASGSLDREAATFFDTFNNQIATFRNTLTRAGISIGDKLLPKIRPLLDEFSAFVRNNGPAIDKFGDQVADAFVGIVENFRNLPWASIIDGLRLSGALAKGVLDVFTKLPGPLQAALIGGFAVNKATGGLLTGITKDLGGALFAKITTGSFFGRGATPANPLFVSAVGGGLGGPGVVGAGGGILSKVLPIAAIATAAFSVWETQQNVSAQSTAQSVAIKERQAEVLPTATATDLRTQLAAIDTGIAQIRSNPLLVLVQGEALANLQAMRTAAQTQLATIMNRNVSGSPDDRGERAALFRLAADRPANDAAIRAKTDQVRMAIDRTRAAILTNRPIVTVNTSVSVSTTVSGGATRNAIQTYNTWSGGNATNRLRPA